MPSFFRTSIPLIAAIFVAACGGGNTASNLAHAPEFAPTEQTKCGVGKSQERPLVVEWPASDRGALEALAKQGLVPVRYSGCEMEVLTRCRAPGTYAYTGITHKHDRIHIKDEDSLYANVPVHAAQFEAKLKESGELNVEMTIVGRYDADRPTVRKDELRGECDTATHVVSALTVGAFEFSAGADVDLQGGGSILTAKAGASSKATREMLARDGEDASCQSATGTDKTPPSGCGALIRLEVVPIAPPAAAPAPAPVMVGGPACPAGTGWDGVQCSPTFGAIGGSGMSPAPEEPFVPKKVKAPPPPGKLRPAHYVIGGVVIAALGVTIVTGALSLSDRATVDANCLPERGYCANQTGVDAGSTTKSMSIASTVGLGVTLVGLFTLPFISLDRAKPPAAKASLMPTPGGAMGTWGGTF